MNLQFHDHTNRMQNSHCDKNNRYNVVQHQMNCPRSSFDFDCAIYRQMICQLSFEIVSVSIEDYYHLDMKWMKQFIEYL